MSWYVLYKERTVNALRLDDRDSALSTPLLPSPMAATM
jgi:hypothetical protein